MHSKHDNNNQLIRARAVTIDREIDPNGIPLGSIFTQRSVVKLAILNL